MMIKDKKLSYKIQNNTVVSFIAMLLLCIFAGMMVVHSRMNTAKLEMENLIIEKSTQIQDAIHKLLYKTEVLSALIIQGNGDIDNFDLMAETIMDDTAILNVLIAPNGVVSKAYPPASARSLVGLNFFDENEWAGNREALLARDTGQLVLAGPFVVTSGDLAITGRKPVYIKKTPSLSPSESGNESGDLWGLVSVTLRFPEALSAARLEELAHFGVDYEIWRINPDTEEKQVIAGSAYKSGRNFTYTEMPIEVQNAQWYFRIYTEKKWYSYIELWLFAIVGLSISFLVAFVMQKNIEIRLLQKATEEQNKTIVASITYASKIQRDLLPNARAISDQFADSSVIWEPRDILGGDIYWMKPLQRGTVLCVADCTGHGVPGALLTMLVVSAMQVIATHYNCHDTSDMVHKLDQRLASALNAQKDTTITMSINDGCDLAVVFVANDGSVNISASGLGVFVCDGKKVLRIKSHSYDIGEGKVRDKDEINLVSIPADPDKKFYIASDGLFDQMNIDKKKWGFKRFESIVLNNHNEPLQAISKKVWDAFTTHQGDEMRCDDVQLICFQPKIDLGNRE